MKDPTRGWSRGTCRGPASSILRQHLEPVCGGSRAGGGNPADAAVPHDLRAFRSIPGCANLLYSRHMAVKDAANGGGSAKKGRRGRLGAGALAGTSPLTIPAPALASAGDLRVAIFGSVEPGQVRVETAPGI